jgi:hypothetical protein
MLVRIIGIAIGISILLYILLLRGLPVLGLIKIIPLGLLVLFALAFIYAGIASDK